MKQALAKILIVEDEPQIRRFLRIGLEAHEYEVLESASGQEGIRLCISRKPDLVVVDLGLPDMDGKEVIRSIREWSRVPIVILSVRSREEEKIEGLDVGADDYVVKPFGMGELLARIRALLRKRPDGGDAPTVFTQGMLKVDFTERRVTLAGRAVQLTKKEYAILKILATHAGRVITHGQLLREIWGAVHEHDTQYLRVYIGHLREKLEDDPSEPKYIVTEPGVGYRLLSEAQ